MLAVAAGVAQARTVDVISSAGFPEQAAVGKGVRDALAAAGLTRLKRFTLDFTVFPGDGAAATAAQEAVARKPDVIIAVGMAAAKAAIAATSTIPVVYAVTGDPVAAELVDTPDATGTNVTGAADAMDAQTRATLIRQIIPGARRVGMVYDPGQADSAALAKRLRTALPSDDMTLVDAVATRAADVGAAARSLVDKVDAIYTDSDAVVNEAYGTLVQLCDAMKIPLIASTTADVKRGATAALGINYHGLGVQAGKLAARIIKGAKPGDIPSASVPAPAVYVNLDAAARQGVALPDGILESAHVVGR